VRGERLPLTLTLSARGEGIRFGFLSPPGERIEVRGLTEKPTDLSMTTAPVTNISSPWLNRFAWLLAGLTFVLIVAGASVTSNRAGLAVPDWPTSYGYPLLQFPMAKMVGGIFYEHGHRLIASLVGLLTLVMAVWLLRVEPRRGVRYLGLAALAAVILQGSWVG